MKTLLKLCATLVLMSGSALANDRTVTLDIPPQALGSAFETLARQADVQFFYAADTVRGKETAGLVGTFTPREAVEKLLADSGLTHTFTAEDAVAVQSAQNDPPPSPPTADPKPPAEEAPVLLPPITVTASPYDDTSYNALDATTATKTDTPIMETPVSIQVVPQQILKDQQVVRLQDAVENVSGVRFVSSSGNFNDNFLIRGFTSTFRFRNGRRFLAPIKADFANIEQVEVLKGPAAVLYGRVEPGGIINLVTKKPLTEPYYALQQQFGSYDFFRTTVDATGPIDADKTLLYRFNLGYKDTESFRDELFDRALFIAPTVTWRPTEATEINLSYEHREQDTFSDSGIPVLFADGRNFIPPISIRSQFTEPDVEELDYDLVDLNASQRFSALNTDWIGRGGFQYEADDSQFREISVFGVQPLRRTLDRFIFFGDAAEDTYSAFLDLTGKFRVWDTEHTVLLGADYFKAQREFPIFGDRAGRFGPFVTVDLFRPILGRVDIATIQAQPPDFFRKNREEWYGIYFQDQITLWDKLHILGGGRYDWAETSSGGSSVSLDDIQEETIRAEQFSPRVGVVYQPWSWLSLYGNYVESFGSNNGVSASGLRLHQSRASSTRSASRRTSSTGGSARPWPSTT